MRNVIGERQTELALTLGKMFTANEALKVGMVDELASDKADAIAKAEKFLKSFAGIPGKLYKGNHYKLVLYTFWRYKK